MARSDLLISLVRAGRQGDAVLFQRTVEAIVAEERARHHHVLADRLEDNLKRNGPSSSKNLGAIDEGGTGLVVITPQRTLEELILPQDTKRAIEELIEEHQRGDLLRSYNLEPRHRILLVGPPGNGKTTLAEGIAERLMLPLLQVRYEALIGSYLGETASRLRRLFDYARTRQSVLFFDEFDTLGKERGDIHETGEIKRVVSSLLMQIDALPSYVIVVTATNHDELLDRAVWRRFQLRLRLPKPKAPDVAEWFNRFEKRFGRPLGQPVEIIAERLLKTIGVAALSFSELEDFTTDVQRRWILANGTGSVQEILDSRLKQWKARAPARQKLE